ncbi:MAG: hypothetical protein ACK5NB_05510 [Flavobacteriaceae bacterium]
MFFVEGKKNIVAVGCQFWFFTGHGFALGIAAASFYTFGTIMENRYYMGRHLLLRDAETRSA